MADVNTGYSISEIKSLVSSLSENFGTLETAVTNGYNDASPTIRDNWVGEDELAAEKKLVDRLNELLEAAADLVSGVGNSLNDLGMKWVAFQKSNVISGVVGVDIQANFEPLHVVAKKVDFQSTTYDESTNRGVKTGGEEAIESALQKYTTTVKNSVDDLYGSFNSSKAFIGENQSQVINQYVKSVSDSLATVLSAVKDINDSVKTLVGNYKTFEGRAVDAVNKAKSDVNSEVDKSVGQNMRWN